MRAACIAVLASALAACTLDFDPRLLDRLGPRCDGAAEAPFALEEIAPGISTSMGAGIALEDVDGDSDLDLLVADYGGFAPSGGPGGEITGRVLENRGAACEAAAFVDVTDTWLGPRTPGLEEQISVLAAVPLVDDHVDLLAPGYFGTGRTLRGRAGPPFWSATETFFVPDGDGSLAGSAVAAGDLDGDGRLDLALGASALGDGRVIVTDESGRLRALEPSAALHEASRLWIADFDADGTQELLAISEPGPARLLRLDGDVLVDDGGLSGLEELSLRGQVVLGDLDTDGDLDVFEIRVAGTTLEAVVLENVSGAWTAHRGADLNGIGDDQWNFGNAGPSYTIGLADLDLDGLLDVVTTDGTLELFRNATSRGEATAFGFEHLDEASLGLSADLAAMGSRIALGDLEGDGDVDIAVASDSGAHVVRNTVGGMPWLRARLRGPLGNTRGVGAIVCAFETGMLPQSGCVGPGLVGMRVIQSSSAQTEALEVSMATPGLTRVDVRVIWPSGLGVTDTRSVRVSRGLYVGLP